MATATVSKRTGHPQSHLKYTPIGAGEIYAQITVVDGDHGDCNIVDLCQYPQSENRSEPRWRRVLIDTGFNKAEGVVTKAICDVLKNRGIPQSGNVTKTYVPPLREFQVTHFDNDHVGNAGDVIKAMEAEFRAWKTAEADYECDLVCSEIVAPFPDLTATFEGCEYHKTNEPYFSLQFNLEGLGNWERIMSNSSFSTNVTVEVEFKDEAISVPLGSRASIEEIQNPIGTRSDREIRLTWSQGAWKTYLEYAASPESSPEVLLIIITMELQDDGDATDMSPQASPAADTVTLGFNIKKLVGSLVNKNTKIDRRSKKHVSELPGLNLNKKIHKSLLGIGHYSMKVTASPKKKLLKGTLLSLQQASERVLLKNILHRVGPTIGLRSKLAEQILPDKITQHTIGPSPQTLEDLRRYSITYALQYGRKTGGNDVIIDLNNMIINRASIITAFSRPDLESPHEEIQQFGTTMLFTGDAYDQESDIQNSIASWKSGPALNAKPNRFEILKVPHHGSNVTAYSHFYDKIRADVYLICGSHQSHGNPKFSTLKAIIEGFYKNPRVSRNGALKPYRIFLSSPRSLEDGTGKHPYLSPFKRIIETIDLQPVRKHRHYEIWMLRKKANTGNGKPQAWGSIVFHHTATGLDEYFSPTEWEMIVGL